MACSGSKLFATRSRFVDHGLMTARLKSGFVINGCEFKNESVSRHYPNIEPNGPIPDPVKAFYISHTSTILCAGGSSFRGYDFVLQVNGTDVKAIIKGCKISVSQAVAAASENACLSVTDNEVDAFHGLMLVAANTAGRVEFLRNELSPSSTRRIFID